MLETQSTATASRPGAVRRVLGIVFQSDARSTVGRLFIRPFEALDRWVAGLHASAATGRLCMHAGIHVEIERDDGSTGEYVAEQLVGSVFEDFEDGLNWTPIARFRARDRSGWDVTVPPTCFRGVDDSAVIAAIGRLNRIEGRPFLGEDCTQFVERAFARRLFADSPLLRALGIPIRIGDPALPLLARDCRLDPRAEQLLRAEQLRQLPDPEGNVDGLNAHQLMLRAAVAGVALGVVAPLTTRWLLRRR